MLTQAVPGTDEQRLLEFLTHMRQEADDLNRQLSPRDKPGYHARGSGLALDDTGFAKQGKASSLVSAGETCNAVEAERASPLRFTPLPWSRPSPPTRAREPRTGRLTHDTLCCPGRDHFLGILV